MLVRVEEDRFVLVTQSDHAHLASELLALWRDPELLEHPRRQSLLQAIRLHDNGWREVDSAPRVDPDSGAPLSFDEIDEELRMEIWRRGILRYGEEDPYTALLVLTHARELHPERPGMVELVAELEESKETWLEEVGLRPAEIEDDYHWLAVADLLSLVAVNRWSGTRDVHGECEARSRDGELLLDPFFLAGATRFSVPCRRIPRRDYEGDSDLTLELATARWKKDILRVCPA
ncbi:MAG: DUF3891 family protein [Thermoanaerobaculia bacterium]|nr:DUF3891 family protein [Thermoanaerobaculia bacterium]